MKFIIVGQEKLAAGSLTETEAFHFSAMGKKAVRSQAIVAPVKHIIAGCSQQRVVTRTAVKAVVPITAIQVIEIGR